MTTYLLVIYDDYNHMPGQGAVVSGCRFDQYPVERCMNGTIARTLDVQCQCMKSRPCAPRRALASASAALLSALEPCSWLPSSLA